ncbi:MAG TPA: glycoside hydrolase family 3 C-terminal domain-containing protein [Clostridia bacterium]
MARDIKKIISEMTLEEKAGLCSGRDSWHTKGIDRLNIPSIMMSDGPHGLRKQRESGVDPGDQKSVPATCFPTASALACSWDRKLIQKVGEALGEECNAEKVDILLGPGVNIKRSPLCGRNFEYYSEDPYLSSEIAASFIQGVQNQGVGTSLKHFAANNQERLRLVIDSVADERTLREIYLASFEGAVKKSQPWTVMCSYNRLNGEYCSEKRSLLNDILKEEWGFEGFVVSDWGAVNDRVQALAAGLELEMPSSRGERDKKIVEAVKTGKLPESVLDQAVERLLRIIFKAADNNKKGIPYDREKHHQLAREAAGECIVLLKNEDSILPLKKGGTFAIIGDFARNPRYQGGGSSHVNPTMTDNAYEEINKIIGGSGNVLYAKGYHGDIKGGIFSRKEFTSNSDIPDDGLIREAQEIAAKADTAIVFAGLPESYESEGFDRKHMRIPEGHRKLIEAVADVQKNTVVVLSNGSPIEMPWLDKVKGVLECYLGGQAGGGAVADILFGIKNPGGRLAETFPVRLNDNPSFLNFPGDNKKVEYREGIFVGYRYYDAKGVAPLFPFGYGLSYTSFEYTDIAVDKAEISDNESVKISVKVKNTGNMKGKETVQVYVRDIESTVIRPVKELKGFDKIELAPGEGKTVVITLDKRAFACYNTEIGDWHVESGEFEILVGRSSADIVFREKITVNSTTHIKKLYTRNSTLGEIISEPGKAEIFKKELMDTVGILSSEAIAAMTSMFKEMPLRALVSFRDAFTEEKLEKILKKLNSE